MPHLCQRRHYEFIFALTFDEIHTWTFRRCEDPKPEYFPLILPALSRDRRGFHRTSLAWEWDNILYSQGRRSVCFWPSKPDIVCLFEDAAVSFSWLSMCHKLSIVYKSSYPQSEVGLKALFNKRCIEDEKKGWWHWDPQGIPVPAVFVTLVFFLDVMKAILSLRKILVHFTSRLTVPALWSRGSISGGRRYQTLL